MGILQMRVCVICPFFLRETTVFQKKSLVFREKSLIFPYSRLTAVLLYSIIQIAPFYAYTQEESMLTINEYRKVESLEEAYELNQKKNNKIRSYTKD